MMRRLLLALFVLLAQAPLAHAQITVNIGFNLPTYPVLQQVPGHPVYYAPNAPGNYFFHDGLYWVFQSDEWHSSSWYNGPWRRVGRDRVSAFVLRVPVRYYHAPPAYFRGWGRDDAPRWGERWGQDWERSRPDWSRRDHRVVAVPAPLPSYQMKYPQSRYPQGADEQRAIRTEQYRHKPRDPQAREDFELPDRGRGNLRNRRDN